MVKSLFPTINTSRPRNLMARRFEDAPEISIGPFIPVLRDVFNLGFKFGKLERLYNGLRCQFDHSYDGYFEIPTDDSQDLVLKLELLDIMSDINHPHLPPDSFYAKLKPRQAFSVEESTDQLATNISTVFTNRLLEILENARLTSQEFDFGMHFVYENNGKVVEIEIGGVFHKPNLYKLQ